MGQDGIQLPDVLKTMALPEQSILKFPETQGLV